MCILKKNSSTLHTQAITHVYSYNYTIILLALVIPDN